MRYKQYWKSQFQAALSSFYRTGKVNGWKEVSEEMESEEIPINEFVYRISLKNPSASIIVFSSVDKITERTRDIGADAVRIIYEWKTENGLIYSKIAKRNRVETLFENLRESIVEAANNSFNLGSYSWGKLEVALG
jgi:hypothetical protein